MLTKITIATALIATSAFVGTAQAHWLFDWLKEFLND